ncbi:MAG: C4-type zinc ribbon domain-containing protein [Bacteroidetes bacterium]|nr:C4-type zinc ribbon domain-containing protein [Bacteroidota bacterium]
MEATVELKLRSLYNLQLIDSKIDSIQNVRGELPIEVADLEDEITGLNTRIDNLNADIANLKSDVDSMKKGIKQSNALIAKYEEQQNNVKNNREFLALSKEIDMQKLEIMASEKKIKEAGYHSTEKAAQLETTKTHLEDRKKDLKLKKADLDNIIAETEKEEKGLGKYRDKAMKVIDERLAKAYLRIRDNVKNRLGVAPIERSACAGCFSNIPPQRQLDIRQRKKIIVCENCGRILVDADLATESRAELEKVIGVTVEA